MYDNVKLHVLERRQGEVLYQLACEGLYRSQDEEASFLFRAGEGAISTTKYLSKRNAAQVSHSSPQYGSDVGVDFCRVHDGEEEL